MMNRRKLPKLATPLPTNTELNRLLEQGARNPQEERVPLLQALQQAQLLIPVLQPAGRKITGGDGRPHNIKMAVLEIRGGQALTGFTDIDAYRRFAPVQQLSCVAIAATDLCRFAIQGQFQAMVLNPGGPYGYELTLLECQMVAEHLLPSPTGGLMVAPDTKAKIGMPAQLPTADFLAALSDVALEAGATEVYWFWIAIEGGQGHLGIAVQPTDLPLIESIGNKMAPLWKAERPDNPLVDILPLADLQEEVGQTIREYGARLIPQDQVEE